MLNEDALRRIGFTDTNVIRFILNDPIERSRYERELGLTSTTSDGGFNFDYAAETEKAYDDLGAYYDELLEWAQGDVDLALSRLQEDFDTGERFRRESGNLSRESLDLARQDLATNIDTAKRTLQRTQLQRGIFRKSNFDPSGNMGIATAEQGRLQDNIGLQERRQDLAERGLDLSESQATESATTALERGRTDITRADERYKKQLEEERKQRATDLAGSRAQRAYQRFEAQLF